MKFSFSLVSPQREMFAGMVDQVNARGIEGSFGILAGHAPFMTALVDGRRVHVFTDGEERLFEVTGAFADVTPEGLTILAEHVEALS